MSKARQQSSERAFTRKANLGREMNNSKSYPLVITKYRDPKTGRICFSKVVKSIQNICIGKSIVHYNTQIIKS